MVAVKVKRKLDDHYPMSRLMIEISYGARLEQSLYHAYTFALQLLGIRSEYVT